MGARYYLSPDLQGLIGQAEQMLGTRVTLRRHNDSPRQGILIDQYRYGTDQNLIIFSDSTLGMLKDFVVAQNCMRLLFNGSASLNRGLNVLSFDRQTAAAGMKQIYLDILKDEETRTLEMDEKKKLMVFLYHHFRQVLSDLPWNVLANIEILKRFPVMRNAQVYFLIREGSRDIHGLRDAYPTMPARYRVMHNSMHYARDLVLAYLLSEKQLNPVFNIPELMEFSRLDLKDLISSRWSGSEWYHMKMVGDAMANILKITLPEGITGKEPSVYYRILYDSGIEITSRWLYMTGMQDWYRWEAPPHLRGAEQQRVEIERLALTDIFEES